MLKEKEAEFASNLSEKSDAWKKPERLGSALMLALLIEKPEVNFSCCDCFKLTPFY